MAHRFELVEGAGGRWFWRRRAGNGEIEFVGEHYSSKSNAKRAIRRIEPEATIITITRPVEVFDVEP